MRDPVTGPVRPVNSPTPRRVPRPAVLLATMLALLAVLGGCEDRPARSGLPASPRAAPPPVPEDTPGNPAAAGGQRADIRRDVLVQVR